MARRGGRFRFFMLILTLTSQPFLSERPSVTRSCPYLPQLSFGDDAGVVNLGRAERLENISRVLFSPKFLLHLTVIIAIFMIFIAEPLTAYPNTRAGSMQPSIMIYLHGNGTVYPLLLDPDIDGLALYSRACGSLKISMERLLLIHQGRVVETNQSLITLGIMNGTVVFAVVKGYGGGKTTHTNPVSDECTSCGETATWYCVQCEQSYCSTCDTLWHKHPSRRMHKREIVESSDDTGACDQTQSITLGEQSYSDNDESFYEDPSSKNFFEHAARVATLAERFNLTSFRKFQEKIIDATLKGKDSLVIHPTGSGKSICFQFPPVYQNKKGIIITPTISLMQDQVYKLNKLGIPSVFLGSAQIDKAVETEALLPGSKHALVFVTPEWITKPENQLRVTALSSAGKLSLFAIDEAHLFSEWREFRGAYSNLRDLKRLFPSIPIIALTATASPNVEEEIKLLLRDPVIEKSSVNRPNIMLCVEEIKTQKSTPYINSFAKRVTEIIGTSLSIVYTDFIADIGPIVSCLDEYGIKAVGYHGEMDPSSRQESYISWINGRAQVIVATKAFGLGINKPDIRHVIRNGVPESMLSWAQELGRAGRDGFQARATIIYKQSDISHANAWVLNNLNRKDEILKQFSVSWRYVNAHLAGICRRKSLLEIFDENSLDPPVTGDCCDVCLERNSSSLQYTDYREELKILIDALEQVGQKGELKVSEWIRGSKIPWTNCYNKESLSYGNHGGRDIHFWRKFLKQCHVVSLVSYELKSIIKKSGFYAVNGIYYVAQKGKDAVRENKPILLPSTSNDVTTSSHSGVAVDRIVEQKKTRTGKGSNILSVVRQLLLEPENWMKMESKSCYQFPGVYKTPRQQQLYFTEDVSQCLQSCEDIHFLWKDIQLSKGSLNKDRLIDVDIHGNKESLYFRSSPCGGVKYCPIEQCSHVVPVREKRHCPTHNSVLVKSTCCPVDFVYLYPVDKTDNRRWFGGLVRNQKQSMSNLHNHKTHGASKLVQCLKEKISSAVISNPSLTPNDITCGKGLGFIPSAVDAACSHSGKVGYEVNKTKMKNRMKDNSWCPSELEEEADRVDENDNSLSDDEKTTLKCYTENGRPYLVSYGYEEGVKYIFTMSPLMTKVLCASDFIQCDITYDECSDYPYIFNAVAFNNISMEWMVIARLRLNKQDAIAYCLCFRKIFSKCTNSDHHFKLGETLMGIVTDWSDAEIKGLKMAIGSDVGEKLLRGCSVHWLRSCKRVAERIATSTDKVREKSVFLDIATTIQKLQNSSEIIACFEALCGVRKVEDLCTNVPVSCSSEDAKYVDEVCNWSIAKHWAQWWKRKDHLKMLSRAFSAMEPEIWNQCPTTTNAVERKNKDCKTDTPNNLRSAMIKVYKIDKVCCLKHLAAEDGLSLSYRSKTEESRRMEALGKRKQRSTTYLPDCSAEYGPPDCPCNSDGSPAIKSHKRKAINDLGDNTTKKIALEISPPFTPNPHPEVLGKDVRMKFSEKKGKHKWYEGVIVSYNGIRKKYGVYFPCDKQTVETYLDDEDLEFTNEMNV